MPVSFSCRRASWLQSWVQTRGEEEQVNAEGRSGGRVDKRKTAHRGRLLLGDTRLTLSWQQANVRLGIWIFFFPFSFPPTFCGLFSLGHFWDKCGKSWGPDVCGFGGKNGTWVRVGWGNRITCYIWHCKSYLHWVHILTEIGNCWTRWEKFDSVLQKTDFWASR